MVPGNGRLFWISMRRRVANCASIFNQTNHNGGLILLHFDSLSLWLGGREEGGERGLRGGFQTQQLLDSGVVIAPLLRRVALIASESWHNRPLVLWKLIW